MKKKIKRLLIAITLIFVIGTLILLLMPDAPDAEYRTEAVTRGDIAQTVNATGTLNPIQVVNVGTQVSGTVSRIYVAQGEEVKQGQLLAEIDPKLLLAELKQNQASAETARLNAEQARRDLERTRELVAKDYAPKVDLEKAELSYASARNQYDNAKAQVERAEVNLGYSKIISPINGTIISQDVNEGQTVAASFQTPNLFKIAGDLTQMKIDVNLPEADIGQIKPGLPAKFTVDAFQDRSYEGKVETINLNPNNQQGVVTYTVTVSVQNSDKSLLPGMTANAGITLLEKKDVLRVPVAALRFKPPKTEQKSGISALFSGFTAPPRMRGMAGVNIGSAIPTIYVLENNQPKEIILSTGATDDMYVEAISPVVKEGDQVIIGLLKNGKR